MPRKYVRMWQVRTKDFRVRKGSIFYILLPEGGGEKYDFQKKRGEKYKRLTWNWAVFRIRGHLMCFLFSEYLDLGPDPYSEYLADPAPDFHRIPVPETVRIQQGSGFETLPHGIRSSRIWILNIDWDWPGVLDPWVVLWLPVAQTPVTVEALHLVRQTCVQQIAQCTWWSLIENGHPLAIKESKKIFTVDNLPI